MQLLRLRFAVPFLALALALVPPGAHAAGSEPASPAAEPGAAAPAAPAFDPAIRAMALGMLAQVLRGIATHGASGDGLAAMGSSIERMMSGIVSDPNTGLALETLLAGTLRQSDMPAELREPLVLVARMLLESVRREFAAGTAAR